MRAEAPGSPDDSGFEMTHWRSDLYDLELPHDPLLSLLPEMSSPPKGELGAQVLAVLLACAGPIGVKC